MGKKYKHTYAEALHRTGGTTIISGYPLCPECGGQLNRDVLGVRWSCEGCSTVWTTLELVVAIEGESRLMKSVVSIRNLQ